MKIRFWGTRGGIAVPAIETMELGGNTTCFQITLDQGIPLIFDAGTGIIEYAAKGLDVRNIKEFHLFISHFHWDHILGFPFFFPIHLPAVKINIYSSCAAQDLTSRFSALFDGTYSPLRDIKNTKAKICFQTIPKEGLTIGSALVRSYPVDHTDRCDAFRIDDSTQSLSIVTDHENRLDEKNKKVIEFISGSDVLIHDGEFTEEQYQSHQGWGHSSIEKAIQNADEARVKRLFLTHHNSNNTDDFLRLYLHKISVRQKLKTKNPISIAFAEENIDFSF